MFSHLYSYESTWCTFDSPFARGEQHPTGNLHRCVKVAACQNELQYL